MTKRNKIIYWIATIWLSLGMISTGIVQLFNVKAEIAFIVQLGYPIYFINLLGFWKIVGVVFILIPKLPLLKEWAYAGFFFTMTGALYSHICMNNSMKDIYPAILLLVLTIVSWYYNPYSFRAISKSSKSN